FVSPFGRPESLLFASPKRSNQEKGDPTSAPTFLRNAGSLRCSESVGRRELAHPCARTCAPFPAGFLRYSALHTGPRAERASPPDCIRPRRRLVARPSRSPRLCGQDSRSTGPLSGGGRAEDQPEGTRARCARVFRQYMDVLSKNPGARTRTRRAGCPEGARPGWPFSWLLLFGHSKRRSEERRVGKGWRCRWGSTQ